VPLILVTVAKETPVTIHRNERVLAFMALAIVAVSIIAFFAILIAAGAGLTYKQFQSGIWPSVAILPDIGLPIAFVLILALLITNLRRRSREAKASTKK
jgi:hypothetical protein